MTDLQLPKGVSVRLDVVHTTLPGYRPLSLDLYVPDGGARAVCVYVHGGGWRMGSRREGPGPLSPTSGRLFARMARQGLAVASVDYRLSGEARYPAQVNDVRAACRWVLDDEDCEVRGLPLVVFGVSAGGHLAGLCGLDASLPVRAVALWYAVTDLPSMAADVVAVGGEADQGAGSREALLLGAPVADMPDVARRASPVAHVRSDAPPFLLLHGDKDVLVPARQSERLHEALLAAGGRSTFELVAGHNHMFTGIPQAHLEALVDRTCAFLLAHIEDHDRTSAATEATTADI